LELHSRDRELTEIAKSIASLAELFKDLSVLVIDQGTLLDSVEYNIEQTAVEVEEAVKELSVATKLVTLPPYPSATIHPFLSGIRRILEDASVSSYCFSSSLVS
jgi:hypothetical protein